MKKNISFAFFSSLSVILFLLLLLITLTQCSPETVQPQRIRDNTILSKTEETIVTSAGKFGINLIKEISVEKPSENIIVSPLSVSTAFGMALNGADGTTYQQIRNTLGLQDLDLNEINKSFKSVNQLLSGMDSKVVFNSANSVWYRSGFQVEKNFIDVNKNYFDAEINEADFNKPATIDKINDWVKQSTNSKIEKIIDKIGSDAVMYLINAIYFKGTWKYQFDENVTHSDEFYITPSEPVQCQMMAQKNKFSYYYNSNYQAVELPYGDGSFSMIVLLPKEGENVNELLSSFSADELSTIRKNFSETELTLFLPKFKLEYEATLNDYLINLGMTDAFEPERADFSGINKDGGLFISEVKHKTFVEVNEEGTEAAAVTSIGISLTSSAGGNDQFFLKIDKPFLFVICEKNTNTILFIGKIVNPL